MRFFAPRGEEGSFPPLLLGATVFFWGWLAELWAVAAVGAAVLEWPRLTRWRWEFTAQDLNRLWDLCAWLFVGVAVVLFAATDITTGPARFAPWLPVIFFPFVAAVGFAARDEVRWNTYFWLLRRKSPRPLIGRHVRWWYFAVCLFAASGANAQDYRFVAGLVTLGGWALWGCRSRRAPAVAWAACFAAAVALGVAGQLGMTRLQALTMQSLGLLIGEMTPLDVDVTQTRTALGMVGRLKMSNRVMVRVTPAKGQPPPALLRKATFDVYEPVGHRSPRWTTLEADFADVTAGAEVGTWPLLAGAETGLVAEVSLFLPVGTGILPVPHGAAVLTDLLAAATETNRYGSVRTRESQPLVRYAVRYGGAASVDAPPTARDLMIPEVERAAVAQIAGELGLANAGPAVVLERVGRFFAENFSYRQYLRGTRYDPTGRNTPVRQFLLRDRAGHCEFFATATALLLREAGIPTRYAVGYSVPDDGRGGTQLVRARHAHAWVLAYVDGAWRDFDTTPGSWEAIEEAARPPLQWLSDTFGWARYAFARWRYYTDQGLLARVVIWLAPVVVGWVAWRIFARRRTAGRSAPVSGAVVAVRRGGTDSEFYRIEEYLARAGRGRRPTETLGDWLRREQLADSLREVVALHYAYRFDPRGVTPEQRRELQARVAAWLAAPPASGKVPVG